MIYPTLFIGLGSTGLAILEKFQELVLEHYGRASLDIFRYIAIEGKETAEITRSEWGENEITLLKPVIRSTDAINNAIKSGEKEYLKDWLNTELLKIEGGNFTDGASNIRMAGRIILWENWNSITKAINDAYNQITTVQNKTQAEAFLGRHYARHRQPVDDGNPLVGDLPSVYIVGTLCGGTCSGMFIDIGYYAKQITGLWAAGLPNPNLAKVIGAFSIFDAATLKSAQQEGIRTHAANCWAALKEYDFFCHSQTRCQSIFPDGTYIDTNERPIDYLYLLSCTATDNDNRLRSNFRKRDGSPDEASINHMAATILFTETVGTLLGTKEAIRTDYRGRPRAIMRNKNEHSPCIATCGIATIWYPKYRIALGSACRYGASLCKEWLGEIDSNTRQIIARDIQGKWLDMLNPNVGELTSSPTGDIIKDVEQEFGENKDKSTSQFKRYLQERLSLLNKGEKYDKHISDPGRIGKFRDKLRGEIYNFIKEIIDTGSNLAYAEYSLKDLDKAIANTIMKLPSDYPAPDMSVVEESLSDILGKFVFKLKEMKEEIIKEYMIRQIKLIRNFYMRLILEEIREEIGIGKDLSKRKREAGELTVKEYLDKAKKSLNSCIEYFEKRYDDLSGELAHTQDVTVVSKGLQKVIKDDIDTLVAQLGNIAPEEKEAILSKIKSNQRLSQVIGFGIREDKTESIKEKIMEQLIREVLQRTGDFNVVKHVLDNWTPSEIAEFGKHGLPHLELTPGHLGLASVNIGRPVSFVAGGDQQGLNNLLQNKLSGTSIDGLFASERSPVFLPELSHMVVFYREEPLMYMDDNLATAALFENCYKDGERASVYGLHIHKGGRSIFDPRIFAREDKTKNELMPIALKILSVHDENGKWISSDIFEIERGRLILRGARKSRVKFRLTGDEKGIELCAQEQEIYEHFNNLIEERLNNITRDNFIERFNNYLERIEQKIVNEDKEPGPIMEEERKKIMGIKLIKEYFPEEED